MKTATVSRHRTPILMINLSSLALSDNFTVPRRSHLLWFHFSRRKKSLGKNVEECTLGLIWARHRIIETTFYQTTWLPLNRQKPGSNGPGKRKTINWLIQVYERSIIEMGNFIGLCVHPKLPLIVQRKSAKSFERVEHGPEQVFIDFWYKMVDHYCSGLAEQKVETRLKSAVGTWTKL